MPTRIIGMNQSNRVQFAEDSLVTVEKDFPESVVIGNDLPKKVRWKPDEKLAKKYYSLSKKDMPTEERESYWYSKSDDKKIFAAAKMTVKMIMMGKPFDDVTNTSRGLECKTRNESMKRVRAKKRVTAALKTEQELQRLEGVRNPERLAVAIAKHTEELAALAAEQGIEDEQEVQEYLNDVRRSRDDFRKYIESHSVPSSE